MKIPLSSDARSFLIAMVLVCAVGVLVLPRDAGWTLVIIGSTMLGLGTLFRQLLPRHPDAEPQGKDRWKEPLRTEEVTPPPLEWRVATWEEHESRCHRQGQVDVGEELRLRQIPPGRPEDTPPASL